MSGNPADFNLDSSRIQFIDGLSYLFYKRVFLYVVFKSFNGTFGVQIYDILGI